MQIEKWKWSKNYGVRIWNAKAEVKGTERDNVSEDSYRSSLLLPEFLLFVDFRLPKKVCFCFLFLRGSQWTGAYVMEFRDLISSSPVEVRNQSEEARFSFLQGGYVEDFDLKGSFLSNLLLSEWDCLPWWKKRFS